MLERINPKPLTLGLSGLCELLSIFSCKVSYWIIYMRRFSKFIHQLHCSFPNLCLLFLFNFFLTVIMSKKRQASHLSNENVEDLSVPPGFVSLTSFILKRVGKIEESDISKDVLDTMSGMTGNAILKRTFRRTARIVIDPANHNSEESDIEQCDKVISLLILIF